MNTMLKIVIKCLKSLKMITDSLHQPELILRIEMQCKTFLAVGGHHMHNAYLQLILTTLRPTSRSAAEQSETR